MRKNKMGSMLISIAAVLFIAYCGLGVILYLMQPVFLYSPTREVTYTPGGLGLDFENVVFKTSDGLKLTGWYIPAANSELTVLFCHGNGGNMMHRLDSINIFYNLGLNCFIFDYRGYGNSEGKPTEEGTYLDAAAAYKWLTEEKKIPPDDIIIFGRSLGGSIAAQLASKVEARALIIESGFTSYVDTGKKFYPYMPVQWFASYSYSTIDYVKNVHCPVMLIHSRNDEIVPFEFSLELHEAANEPKELIEISGSHNDGFLVSSEIYKSAWVKWIKFLTEYEKQSAAQPAS
ncbi:MAG: alpha/beta hydrolase [Sedimentisphaerales bacterium]